MPTVDELKDALREKGLPVSGTKDELEARLADHPTDGDADAAPASGGPSEPSTASSVSTSGSSEDEPVDVTEDVDVEPASAEDQAEQAEEVYDEDLGVPPVNQQVGPPLTEDQLRQIAEQTAAVEAVAESAGWQQEDEDTEEDEAVEAEAVEVPQTEPVPTEALAERKAQNRADGQGPLAGSAEERQRDGATEESARSPLLQRPAQEQSGAPTNQNAPYQLGDTLPGERSVDNDHPAYQVAVNHVPGTPLAQAENVGEVQSAPPQGLADYQRIYDEHNPEEAA